MVDSAYSQNALDDKGDLAISSDKLVALKDAIATHVDDGDSVVLGAALENAIPFAANHELIRQGRRGLTLIAPISDMSTDLLIGAGCVAQVTGAWVGSVSGGLGHNYRRAAETGTPHPIRINDHSNFALGMALFAGAYGLPYVPIKSVLGSGIMASNPAIKLTENPFAEETEPVALVPPLKPDVAILVAQRADRQGNCHIWGSTGVSQESAVAADRVIVLTEEIVAPEVIASDPGRVLFPGFLVNAVCQVVAGCHPAPLTGYWQRDNAFFNDYHEASREAEGFDRWCDEWVREVADHDGYRAKLGEHLENLRIHGQALSAPANWAAE